MNVARQCDICGRLYSRDNKVANIDGIKIFCNRHENKYYDLCEDCYNKVKEALRLKEEYRNSKK